SSEKLGNRKLAYTVRKFNEGNYNLLTVEADGSLVAELERRLRVTEPVIKFITVRMDEEEKRINKIKKLRSTKIKQSTVNAQTAQANAAAAASQAAASQPVAPQRSVERPAETAAAPEAIA
ncbi:MAG: 30S ribosomal protein S6, partial [Acidobacteriaceae bacterium]